MYARATFIGRATKDCEVAELPSGKMKGDFGIACNPYSKDETSFFDIQAYDKKAEFCGKYVTKGKLLYLECTIRPRAFEDRSGNKRYVTDYILQEIKLLSSDKPQTQEEQPRKRPTLLEMEDTDGDIPF